MALTKSKISLCCAYQNMSFLTHIWQRIGQSFCKINEMCRNFFPILHISYMHEIESLSTIVWLHVMIADTIVHTVASAILYMCCIIATYLTANVHTCSYLLLPVLPSSMFFLHTDKEQWSISAQFSGIVSLHFGAFECPSDGGFGDASEIHT